MKHGYRGNVSMANSELKEKWKSVVDESRSSGLTVAGWS
jgi:hypothetical protein